MPVLKSKAGVVPPVVESGPKVTFTVPVAWSVLVGTTYLVGKTAVGDPLTVGVAAASLVVLSVWKGLPEPLVVLADRERPVACSPE